MAAIVGFLEDICCTMVIDIILIVLAIMALIMGWRKGFIVQLLQLVGIYSVILFAPDFANEVGAIFTDDAGLAYLIGFGVIIIGAWLVIWVIAPLLRKLLLFDALIRLDSLLGMALALLTAIIITSVLCSLLVTANIGEMRADKVLELGSKGLKPEMIEEYAEMLENRDESVMEYFEPKYIDYETLDESKLFGPLAALGDFVCPGLEDIEEEVMQIATGFKGAYID